MHSWVMSIPLWVTTRMWKVRIFLVLMSSRVHATFLWLTDVRHNSVLLVMWWRSVRRWAHVQFMTPTMPVLRYKWRSWQELLIPLVMVRLIISIERLTKQKFKVCSIRYHRVCITWVNQQCIMISPMCQQAHLSSIHSIGTQLLTIR